MDNLYLLGILSTTHKLAGTLKLSTNFSNIDKLEGLPVVAIKDNDIIMLTIKEISNYNGKKALINFNEINSIDEARKILSYKLYIRDDLISDYEIQNEIGYNVYENNYLIGQVIDIMTTNAHDILVIESDKGEEILIPYIDVFVKEIDDDKKSIKVQLIEGMI